MSRKSRRRKNGDLGFVSVRVMAEYDSSGLWLMHPAGVFRHGGISGEALRLPPALRSEFAEWIEAYWIFYLDEDAFDMEAFNRRGRELAQAVKAQLGPESYVEFVPEHRDSDGRQAEVIE